MINLSFTVVRREEYTHGLGVLHAVWLQPRGSCSQECVKVYTTKEQYEALSIGTEFTLNKRG